MNRPQLLKQLIEIQHPSFRRMRALSREKKAFVHEVPFFLAIGPAGLGAERFRGFVSQWRVFYAIVLGEGLELRDELFFFFSRLRRHLLLLMLESGQVGKRGVVGLIGDPRGVEERRGGWLVGKCGRAVCGLVPFGSRRSSLLHRQVTYVV